VGVDEAVLAVVVETCELVDDVVVVEAEPC
jgi:hypothetical protein